MSLENVTSIPEKWVNLADVATHLSMSNDTVRSLIQEGKLPFCRIGKCYKFKISEIDAWIRSGKIND